MSLKLGIEPTNIKVKTRISDYLQLEKAAKLSEDIDHKEGAKVDELVDVAVVDKTSLAKQWSKEEMVVEDFMNQLQKEFEGNKKYNDLLPLYYQLRQKYVEIQRG